MASIRNLVIDANGDQEIDRIVEEYTFIGREVSVDRGARTVTVLAMPSDYKKKREHDSRARAKRERSEGDQGSDRRS
jgi:hypothetical protein